MAGANAVNADGSLLNAEVDLFDQYASGFKCRMKQVWPLGKTRR